MAPKFANKHSTPLILLAYICTTVAFAARSVTANGGATGDKYVRDACSVTRYRNLCIRSLAPFSSAAKDRPVVWARAGVSVTLSEAKGVARYLVKLNRYNNPTRGRSYKAALSDCVELFGNAIDELHQSLGILRNLSKRTLGTQIGDLNTWLSAALTDADTCLEGFQGQKRGIKEVMLIRAKVSRASCITSNALALVNKLASSGFGSVADP
ncbi:Pectinesterase inhibitor domain containing protein [Parasponia andersonii]|uniref:Pectinesterase inhibitor domain containing protein n=1 Tax=Parasponia andersonii TaxID=3476 RepID=A0A2P5CXY2_PARAD|nr:Pectinesterase inhibitor domain containing protein [Parasponia andersonii]